MAEDEVEIGAVRGVHSVEPVDELIRKIVAKLFIKTARQFRRNRHRIPHLEFRSHVKGTLGQSRHQSYASRTRGAPTGNLRR